MNFPETIEYLLSLGHETVAIKLGLRNTEVLLEALGNPQSSFQSIQIAGTNGKGSTAVMLEAICSSANISTGLYTSPHLMSITERIRIDGEDISESDFAAYATRVSTTAANLLSSGKLQTLPTFFEHVTAIALLAFKEAGLKLAILETGLGGRLDATTVAGANTVAITPIALDHQEYLGETLAEIAGEKAAIIRSGVAAVIAPQPPEALEVILRRCAEVDVEPVMERQANIEEATDDGHFRVTFESAEARYDNVLLGLRGRHQITNAMVTIQLAESLRKQAFEIPKDAVLEGLEKARHPGRLELLPGHPSILLDGAHNPSGAQALRDYLNEFVKEPVTMVFGAMKDKKIEEIAEILFPLANLVILAQPDHPRAASVEELGELAAQFVSRDRITSSTSVCGAIDLAKSLTPPHGTICATGSLYLVGEMMAIMNAVISGSPQRSQGNTEDEQQNKQPDI